MKNEHNKYRELIVRREWEIWRYPAILIPNGRHANGMGRCAGKSESYLQPQCLVYEGILCGIGSTSED